MKSASWCFLVDTANFLPNAFTTAAREKNLPRAYIPPSISRRGLRRRFWRDKLEKLRRRKNRFAYDFGLCEQNWVKKTQKEIFDCFRSMLIDLITRTVAKAFGLFFFELFFFFKPNDEAKVNERFANPLKRPFSLARNIELAPRKKTFGRGRSWSEPQL